MIVLILIVILPHSIYPERGIDGIAFPLSAPLEYKEAKVLAERGIDGIAIPPLRALGV